MLQKLRDMVLNLRYSLWFVPTLMVVGGILLAFLLVEVDTNIATEWFERFPRLFGTSPDGARSLLQGVAGSMISVVGITFSITIVALSLTSNQYTPRVLRNFMRDRSNQYVLGIFVSVFVYCLIVLRTIRGGENVFVPSISVLAAIVLAIVSVGFLIYFIHHIATSIQASTIISSIAAETINAMSRLFPAEIGDEPEQLDEQVPPEAMPGPVWTPIRSTATGYIQRVDPDELMGFAVEHDVVLRMEYCVGQFVIVGKPLASVNSATVVTANMQQELNELYSINRDRTIPEDAGFGIRQIVDIALKALSPGVNDTTTAITCLDYLGAILDHLAHRRIPSHHRTHHGKLRVLARGPTFHSLMNEAFHEIRQSAGSNVEAYRRIVMTLSAIGGSGLNEHRRGVIERHARLVAASAAEAITLPEDCSAVQIELDLLARKLGVDRIEIQPRR